MYNFCFFFLVFRHSIAYKSIDWLLTRILKTFRKSIIILKRHSIHSNKHQTHTHNNRLPFSILNVVSQPIILSEFLLEFRMWKKSERRLHWEWWMCAVTFNIQTEQLTIMHYYYAYCISWHFRNGFDLTMLLAICDKIIEFIGRKTIEQKIYSDEPECGQPLPRLKVNRSLFHFYPTDSINHLINILRSVIAYDWWRSILNSSKSIISIIAVLKYPFKSI